MDMPIGIVWAWRVALLSGLADSIPPVVDVARYI